MTPTDRCDPLETIGRRLFTRDHINRRGKVNYRAFYFPGHSKLSVDRLDGAPTGFLEDLAKKSATKRKQKFHGWAGRRTVLVETGGIAVVPSPIKDHPTEPDNPYHADIVLPESVKDNRARKEQANKLVKYPWQVHPPDPRKPFE